MGAPANIENRLSTNRAVEGGAENQKSERTGGDSGG
jgi:hypothetical protein